MGMFLSQSVPLTNWPLWMKWLYKFSQPWGSSRNSCQNVYISRTLPGPHWWKCHLNKIENQASTGRSCQACNWVPLLSGTLSSLLFRKRAIKEKFWWIFSNLKIKGRKANSLGNCKRIDGKNILNDRLVSDARRRLMISASPRAGDWHRGWNAGQSDSRAKKPANA